VGDGVAVRHAGRWQVTAPTVCSLLISLGVECGETEGVVVRPERGPMSRTFDLVLPDGTAGRLALAVDAEEWRVLPRLAITVPAGHLRGGMVAHGHEPPTEVLTERRSPDGRPIAIDLRGQVLIEAGSWLVGLPVESHWLLPALAPRAVGRLVDSVELTEVGGYPVAEPDGDYARLFTYGWGPIAPTAVTLTPLPSPSDPEPEVHVSPGPCDRADRAVAGDQAHACLGAVQLSLHGLPPSELTRLLASARWTPA
jgi:hypothetical protein